LVATLAVCLFLTVWRTALPLKLASRRGADRGVAFTDAILLSAAVGWSGAWASPYVVVPLVAVAIAAFGWSYRVGIVAAAVAAATATTVFAVRVAVGASEWNFGIRAVVVFVALVAMATGPAALRQRLLDAERRRRSTGERMDALTETNDLLTMLNSVATRLPSSLNIRDALDNTHEQLTEVFGPSVVCLLERDDSNDEWVPKLAEGCVMRPTCPTDVLPEPLRRCLDRDEPVLVATFHDDGISAGSHSGLYVRLTVRDRVVGVLGIEHRSPGHFDARDVMLLSAMSNVIALMLDNARRYGRLRSLGAEEERNRLARELHDRLGQWLTNISFALERIMGLEQPTAGDLGDLYIDVQNAMDELRETLRQLRSGVTNEHPLAAVGGEILERFRERTDLAIDWEVPDPFGRLPVPVENELLRILLESLSNIDRHAAASSVSVRWDVRDGTGTLTIRDDGRGFVPDQGVRDRAYGLVGMRERADVIGARLVVDSAPGRGTTIAVTAGANTETREI
jgi:signal transduction histidine kinase